MNAEQYCRETAEACGYDLIGSVWLEGRQQMALQTYKPGSRGLLYWHPHINVAQALEVARVMRATVEFGCDDVTAMRWDIEPQPPTATAKYEDHPTTEAAVCAATQTCWEAERE